MSAGIWVIYTVAKSGSKMVTLFDSYLMTYESVHSSPSLLSEYFWYDKLWGPSQRVVTLFFIFFVFFFSLRRAAEVIAWSPAAL